jgi:hypothetical protein
LPGGAGESENRIRFENELNPLIGLSPMMVETGESPAAGVLRHVARSRECFSHRGVSNGWEWAASGLFSKRRV